jgi:hypothetical protein
LLALLGSRHTGLAEVVYRWPVRKVVETLDPVPGYDDPALVYFPYHSVSGPDGVPYTSFAAVTQQTEEWVFDGVGCNRGQGFEILATSLDDVPGFPDPWVFSPMKGFALLAAFNDGSAIVHAIIENDASDPPSSGRGMFVVNPETGMRALAVTGQTVPGLDPGEVIESVNHRDLGRDPSGSLAMGGLTRSADGSQDDHNRLLLRGTIEELAFYWRRHDPAPGFPEGTLLAGAVNMTPRVNTAGSMAWSASSYGPLGVLFALYGDMGGGPDLLAYQSMPIPDMPPAYFDGSFANPWIDDRGRIVFDATARNLADGPPWYKEGFWVVEPPELKPRVFALWPVPMPNLGRNVYFDPMFDHAYLNNDGHVLVHGFLENRGITADAIKATSAGASMGNLAGVNDDAIQVPGGDVNSTLDEAEAVCIVSIDSSHIVPVLHWGQRITDLTEGEYLHAMLNVQGNNNSLHVQWVILAGPEITYDNDEALVVFNQYGEWRVILREGSLVDLSGNGTDLRRFDDFHLGGFPNARRSERVILNDRNELVLELGFSDPLSSGTWVFDLSEMVACGPDLNSDDFVDQHDLGLLLAAYGTTPGEAHWSQRADINLDGVVDQADLQEVLAQYEQVCE